ncbi:hypothetical protein QYF36_006915 [Acer negundo]|nr:hypothetical protein QYF36_006915 [Acer negundo]
METNPNIINFSSSSSPTINNPSKPLPNHPIVDEFWKEFPVGYRFCPQDGELILHYLKKIVLNQPLPPNKIVQVNIYQHNPEDLAGTGSIGTETGLAEQLVVDIGRPPERTSRSTMNIRELGREMHWFFIEENLLMVTKQIGSCTNSKSTILLQPKEMLDDWVLCKIYYKLSRSCKARNAEEEEGDPQRTPCDENISQLTTDTQSGRDVMVSSNEEVEASNGMNKKESESGFEDDHSWNPDNSGFGWQQVDWINNANNYNNPYMNIDDFRPPLFK